MNREAMTRGIICSLVDRILKEAETDPERTVRKLVDLGGQLVKGRFQSYFFGMVQTMLEDEDSAYYELARRVCTQVDREALKTLGVNLGYNSCTLGARTIREREAAEGYSIPWAVMFRMQSGGTLPPEEYERFIQEGTALGIRSYIFYAEDKKIDLEPVLERMAAHKDCAFLLALPAAIVTEEVVSRVCELQNLMVAPDSEDAEFPQAAQRLRRARRPYACHRSCRGMEDLKDMESGAWARRVVDAGCMFAFCHTEATCTDEICDRAARYVEETRRSQREAVILSNYYTDHLFIDRVISGSPSFLGIRSDGMVNRCDGRREVSTEICAKGKPLVDVLHQAAAKG